MDGIDVLLNVLHFPSNKESPDSTPSSETDKTLELEHENDNSLQPCGGNASSSILVFGLW